MATPNRKALDYRTAVLFCIGAFGLAFGLYLDDWWWIAGGVVATLGASWFLTEPRPQRP